MITAESRTLPRAVAAPIDPATYKLGMRRLAAGVSIVTTLDGGQPHGLVATSVTSVSASPQPTLLVCVDQAASAHDHIATAGHFCVNILSQEERQLVDNFGARDRTRRFESSRWGTLATGSPALDGALASFDCRVARSFGVQSHTIFVGEVVGVRLAGREIAPLVYVDGHFGRLAVG